MMKLKISRQFIDSLKTCFRLLLFGFACFGLGIVFTAYYVTLQQIVILSGKVDDLVAQSERLTKYENHFIKVFSEIDDRLAENSSRFTRIEHMMRIPRKRAE